MQTYNKFGSAPFPTSIPRAYASGYWYGGQANPWRLVVSVVERSGNPENRQNFS
jgi:hypothetical protein